jgi:hypothetical protein
MGLAWAPGGYCFRVPIQARRWFAGWSGLTVGAWDRKLRLAAAIALAAAPTIAHASEWIQITKPVVACEGIDDSPNLATGVVVYLQTRTLEQGCASLKTGDKLELDGELQSTGAVKFWRPVCPHGCVPSMTPVYAPLPSRAGVYFCKNAAAERLALGGPPS